MKKLTLLNDDTNIKLGDTGTLIQFKASINDTPVFLKDGQTATFRIKNDLGFLKSIDADTNMNGYVFEFDTSELVDLPVGSYQVELAITKSEDNVVIFPDKGFVNFDITENALSVTGEQLPVMSLEAFKDEVDKYVSTKVEEAQSEITNDFQKYVDGLTDNTIATANKACQDATKAVSTANSAVATANDAKTTAQAVSAVANGASAMANKALVQKVGARNLLLDSQKGQSEPWLYKNKDNADMTFMECDVSKVNQAWTRAIGGYNPYDLYQRGLYNTTDTYTFSCYAKIDGDIQLRRGDIVLYSNVTDSNGKSVDISNVNNETWTQISISFKFTEKVPNKNDGAQTIRFEPNVSWDGSSQHAGVGTGYLYLTCPKLEKGDKATDYVPAPEDLDLTSTQNQITQLTLQLAQSQMAQVAQANTDLNTLISNGKWSFNNTTVSNAPGGSKTLTGTLEVTNNGTSGVQTVVDTVADVMFWRTWNGSNFNKWHAVANDSSIISPA